MLALLQQGYCLRWRLAGLRLEEIGQPEHVEHAGQIIAPDRAARAAVGFPHPVKDGRQRGRSVEIGRQRVEEAPLQGG